MVAGAVGTAELFTEGVVSLKGRLILVLRLDQVIDVGDTEAMVAGIPS